MSSVSYILSHPGSLGRGYGCYYLHFIDKNTETREGEAGPERQLVECWGLWCSGLESRLSDICSQYCGALRDSTAAKAANLGKILALLELGGLQ